MDQALQYAASGGQRHGEEGDEPFHDLSPLLGTKLTQSVEVASEAFFKLH